MPQKITITIPQPCHENWDKMSTSEKGKFCSSCEKHVYDFTKSSDFEIRKKLNSGQKICGRFLNSQLNREIVGAKEKSNLWPIAAAGAIGLLGSNADAQTKGEEPVKSEISAVGKSSQPPVKLQSRTLAAGKSKMVEGDVRDEAGQLPGATIVNMRTKEKALSDINGIFIIEAREGDILQADYIGRDTSRFTVNFSKKPVIEMRGGYILGDSEVTVAKRNENEIVVSGVVSDNQGTLPGANVVVKGEQRGVQTDIDGKFSIEVKPNDVLVFSFVGLEEQEVAVIKNMDVTLNVNLDNGHLVGLLVVRRSFVGSVLMKIGNLFRSKENKRY